jgi:site-specific DNA recombinase
LLLSEKYDVQQIIAKLNGEFGLKTRKTKRFGGGPVSRSTMYRTFADPFYSGYFYREGKRYKGSYKAMITVEEFNKVQAILKRPQKAKPQKHEFAFTGLMKCGSCGCSITASKKSKITALTNELRTYSFYHCSKRRGAAKCADKHYTTEAEMINLIRTEISKLNIVPKWKQWATETIAEDYEHELSKDKVLLASTIAFENKLQMELDRLLDLRISGEVTEDKYAQKKTEREMELISVQEKIKRLDNQLNYGQERINEILNFAENIAERFNMSDPKEQRGICRYFGWNWVLEDKKLTFSSKFWLYDLQDATNYYEANKERLEPIKTFTEFKESPYFEGLRTIMRGWRERFRTARQSLENG